MYAGNKWDSRKGKIRLIDKDFGGCIIRRIKETDPKHWRASSGLQGGAIPAQPIPEYIK